MKMISIILIFFALSSGVEARVLSNEVECLAKNIYFEARGASVELQKAVAHVTLNRVRSGKFPDTICGVVYQANYSAWWKNVHGKDVPLPGQCQFKWWCDGKSDRIEDRKSWEMSVAIASVVMNRWVIDNTKGSLYFHRNSSRPHWSRKFQPVIVIDNHIFYKSA